MIIRQFYVGPMDVFCYVVGCEQTHEAMVIDPGGDVDKILAEAEKAGLTIKHIVNTHHHWDHTGGNTELKSRTGARLIMHAAEDDILQQQKASVPADVRLEEEKTIEVGNLRFQVFVTPGHSPGGICLYADGQLFTGDTLFVGDSGRTDLHGGHRPTLGASIRRLMKLPDETIVWPGHDYGPTPSSTLGWEKRNNVNAREYGYYVSE